MSKTAAESLSRRATMRDVAALAGVGLKTVSRVINDEPNVSAATKQRVMQAAHALDYQPDVQAGNLKRGDNRRTGTIGYLAESVANPFDSQVHRAIEQVAIERGVVVYAASHDENPANERAIVRTSIQRRVDGLIIVPAGTDQGYLNAEAERGLPMVFVDREPSGLRADAVISNSVHGAALAVRHLIQHGHRRIAYLGNREYVQVSQLRLRGYLEELGRAGVPTADLPILTDLHGEDPATAVRRLLASAEPPTAIFSIQNMLTVGAVQALRDTGKSHQIALVGFDDLPLANLLDPPLTVIAQDPAAIGSLAAERLFARLDGDTSPPRTHEVEIELIARGSGEIRPLT